MPLPGALKIVYTVEPDAGALARRAAEELVEGAREAVAARGRARIALSGGSTPKAAFELLADANGPFRAAMPWERIELFWVDERSVPPDHADSNYRMTCEALLDHVPIDPARIHRMEGELAPEEAAARYEGLLRNVFRLEGAELPVFDLVALGMGPDGHTGSIFPHTEAVSNVTDLVAANYVPQKSAWRITLTWPVINAARSVFFTICGADKAEAVRQVFTGARDVERLPSQLVRPASGILRVILDEGAAALLAGPCEGAEGLWPLERKR